MLANLPERWLAIASATAQETDRDMESARFLHIPAWAIPLCVVENTDGTLPHQSINLAQPTDLLFANKEVQAAAVLCLPSAGRLGIAYIRR